MATATWGRSRIFYFIELFKNRPVLWNPRHEHYFNRFAKMEAWQEIASIIDAKVDECQAKIQSLLSSNRRERCKIEKFNEKGEKYKSSWFAFEALQFLEHRRMKSRKDLYPEIPGTSDSNNDNFAASDYSYAGSYDGSLYPSSVLLDSTNNQDGDSHDNTYDTSYDETSAPPPVKKKRPCTQSTDPLSDNYAAFSDLVVSKLKSLPPHRAAWLQLRIQELLSREIVAFESEDKDDGSEEETMVSDDEEDEEADSQTKPGESEGSPKEAENVDPAARPEDCPPTGGAEDKVTTPTEQGTTRPSGSVTTVAKKRKSRGRLADNKENLPFLEESYRAFSRCIISQLRYLPTSIALKTQNKIQKVLSDEIVEFYTKKDVEDDESGGSSNVRIKEEPIDSMES